MGVQSVYLWILGLYSLYTLLGHESDGGGERNEAAKKLDGGDLIERPRFIEWKLGLCGILAFLHLSRGAALYLLDQPQPYQLFSDILASSTWVPLPASCSPPFPTFSFSLRFRFRFLFSFLITLLLDTGADYFDFEI